MVSARDRRSAGRFLYTRGQTKSACSTICLVALPDTGSSHVHVWLVPLDPSVVRNPDYGDRQGLRLRGVENGVETLIMAFVS